MVQDDDYDWEGGYAVANRDARIAELEGLIANLEFTVEALTAGVEVGPLLPEGHTVIDGQRYRVVREDDEAWLSQSKWVTIDCILFPVEDDE